MGSFFASRCRSPSLKVVPTSLAQGTRQTSSRAVTSTYDRMIQRETFNLRRKANSSLVFRTAPEENQKT